jgi:hypothetical protein
MNRPDLSRTPAGEERDGLADLLLRIDLAD